MKTPNQKSLIGTMTGLLLAIAIAVPYASGSLVEARNPREVSGGASAETAEHASLATAIDEVAELAALNNMDVWISGAAPPCDAVTFCQSCVVNTIATCLRYGGTASGLCEVTEDHCRCVFECKKATDLLGLVDQVAK